MEQLVIVGAGPAGTTLAYLCAKQGIPTTLIEKEATFDRVFRGEALMPLGLEVLKQMGLYDDLVGLPNRHVRSWDMYVANKHIFQVFEPQDALGEQAVRVVSQPAYLACLVNKAKQFPTFTFRSETAVRDLLWKNGRVCGVKLQDKTELPSKMVIACDGRGSLMRTRANISLTLLPESYDILWFRFPCPKQVQGKTDVMFMGSVKRTALCYNSWDDHMRYALLLPKGSYSKMRTANWIDELCEPAPEWLQAHIRAVSSQIEGPDLLNILVGRAEQWSKPGLLLLGDAAHPMSPIRAQGINMALRDVVVAANHLVPLFQADAEVAALDGAAQAVEAERLPEVKRAQQLQLREARGQTNDRLRPFLINLAKFTAPLMSRFSWSQKMWLDQQKELRFGTTAVELQLPK